MTSPSLTVRGATLVTPRGRANLDLQVSDGRISAIGPDLPSEGDVVDAGGLLALPGFVDTHVHLMDPGETEREDFPQGPRRRRAVA